MKNHYGYGITSRDDVEENFVYRSSGIKRIVPHLKENDVIRIQREGKSYPQIELTVLEGASDHALVIDKNGNEYKLWGEWISQNFAERNAWLRSPDSSESKR